MFQRPKGYDFTAIAKALSDEGRHGALVRAIGQFGAVSSIQIDFVTVRNCLLLIAEIDQSQSLQPDLVQQDLGDAAMANALAVQAIVFYSRSTATRSDHRGHIDARSYLPDDLKSGHDRIIALRNNCVAHFGFGEDHGRGWIREAVTIAARPEGGRGHFDCVRANYLGKDLEILHRIVETLTPIIEELWRKRSGRWLELFDQAMKEDPDLKSLIENYPFDPDSFYLDPMQARLWGTDLAVGDFLPNTAVRMPAD